MFLSIQDFAKRLGTLYNNDVHQTLQLDVAHDNAVKANLSFNEQDRPKQEVNGQKVMYSLLSFILSSSIHCKQVANNELRNYNIQMKKKLKPYFALQEQELSPYSISYIIDQNTKHHW